MLEIRKVARRTKSCSKSEKLLKSCRATSGQPYFGLIVSTLFFFVYFSWFMAVLDYSQPSIFSYFYSIVERAEGIVKELDAGAKRKTWLGRGWRLMKIAKKNLARLARSPHLPPPPTPAYCALAFSFACVNRKTVNSLGCASIEVPMYLKYWTVEHNDAKERKRKCGLHTSQLATPFEETQQGYPIKSVSQSVKVETAVVHGCNLAFSLDSNVSLPVKLST